MSCGTRAQACRPGDPDGAGPSVLLVGSIIVFCWYCSTACHSAALRQPVRCPGLNPLPNDPDTRAAAYAFTGDPLSPHCRYFALHLLIGHFCTARQPLSLRATRSGRQSRRRLATAVASGLHHRTVLRTSTTCPAVLLPGRSSLPGPTVSFDYEKHHNRITPEFLLQSA